MEEREFAARVERWTLVAETNPRGYRLRVAAFALVGYGFVFGWLALLLGVLFGLGFLAFEVTETMLLVAKLVLPLLIVIIVVVRALWVRLEPPWGVRLYRCDVPRLFEVIDRHRATLRAPRVHVVLCDTLFNAGIVQIPRLGAFGWQRNYLVLGLPLMSALPAAELEATILHELGHLMGSHGKLSSWIYRLNITWSRILERVEKLARVGRSKAIGSPLVAFSRWYFPRFNALSFVLRRAREGEADRAAANACGAETVRSALVRIARAGRWAATSFWPALVARSRNEPEPPARIFREFAAAVRELPADSSRFVDEALAANTGIADTHPCLRERIAAINVEPKADVAPFERSAAEEFLGDALDRVETRLSNGWHEWNSKDWSERFRRAGAERARLAELESAREQSQPSLDQAWERATLLAAESRHTEFETALEEIVARAPDFAPALLALGGTRLGRDDERGLAQVERAMALAPAATLAACDAAYGFLKRAGRGDEAVRYAERWRARSALQSRDAAEREGFIIGEPVEAHRLEAHTLDGVAAALRRIPGIRKAYLVRKRLTAFPDPPIFVIGLVTTPWWLLHRRKRGIALRDRVLRDVRLPSRWFCLALDGVPYSTRANFIRVAGRSLI